MADAIWKSRRPELRTRGPIYIILTRLINLYIYKNGGGVLLTSSFKINLCRGLGRSVKYLKDVEVRGCRPVEPSLYTLEVDG